MPPTLRRAKVTVGTGRVAGEGGDCGVGVCCCGREGGVGPGSVTAAVRGARGGEGKREGSGRGRGESKDDHTAE